MEELVAQDLRWLGPLLWIVAEHPLHELDGFWTGSWHYVLQVDLLMFGHGEEFPIGKSPRIWPVVSIGLTKDHRDLLKLIHF